MSDADVLASLYFDTMDIYRKIKVVNKYGITELQEKRIASKVRCSLDKADNVIAKGEIANIVATYKLFCRPTVDIKVGDKLIITYNGVTAIFEAGEPYPYQSHLEIPVTKGDRV